MRRTFFLAGSLVSAVLAALISPSQLTYALVLLSVFLLALIFRRVGAVVGLMVLFLIITIPFLFTDFLNSTLAFPDFWWKWRWKADSWERKLEDYNTLQKKTVLTRISEVVVEGTNVEITVDPSITGVIMEGGRFTKFKTEGTRLNFMNSPGIRAKITVGNLEKLDVLGSGIQITCKGGRIRIISLNGTGISVHGRMDYVDTIEINGMGVEVDLKVNDCRNLEVNGMGASVQMEYLTELTDFKYIEVNGMGADVYIRVPKRADERMIRLKRTGFGNNIRIDWWD